MGMVDVLWMACVILYSLKWFFMSSYISSPLESFFQRVEEFEADPSFRP